MNISKLSMLKGVQIQPKFQFALPPKKKSVIMCKKRRHNDFCYSQTLLTVQSVCMQKPLHIILQFTFFFSSKIIYLCKIGTYNADSHLISLRLNLKRKVSTLYLQSGDRAENIPRSPIPTRLNPIQILFTKMYAFLTLSQLPHGQSLIIIPNRRYVLYYVQEQRYGV